MRKPTLSVRLLTVLGESPLSIPTPALVAITAGLSHPRSRVWTELRKLEAMGLVRKVKAHPGGTRWVLA